MPKQLPLHPNLEQLKNQAKSLLRQWRAGEAPAGAKLTLASAQLAIARENGFPSWAKLKAHVQRIPPAPEASIKVLLHAANRGDLDTIRALLDANPSLVNETGGAGVRTALHEAVDGQKEDAVRLLLERGADPNIRDEGDNAMPLHFAVEKHLFPIVKLLIEHGADTVGEGDYHELGVLGWATAWDYITPNREIVEYLLAHGARHNIFTAVALGEAAVIREIVARSPADLERRMDLTNRRRLPLHLAVIKKQTDSLRVLLDLGANLESTDEAGFTALDTAGFRGETEMAQMLIDRGAKMRLPAAFALKRSRDVERLLKRDPDALKPGHRWGTLIVRAAESLDGDIVEAMIQAGASVNVRDDPKTSIDSTAGFTPLHGAAWNNNVSAARVLMKHGADVCAREERYDGSPAGWANFAGKIEVRDVILQGPVDLRDAVEFGWRERVLAILEEDPGAVNRKFGEWMPLLCAIATNREDIAKLLLERGANADEKAPDGRKLSQAADAAGHPAIAGLLRRYESEAG